jgi:hypothetical protein
VGPARGQDRVTVGVSESCGKLVFSTVERELVLELLFV